MGNGQRPRPKNLNPLDWVLWYIEIDFNRDGFITPDEVIVHCTRVLSNPIAKKVAAALFGTGLAGVGVRRNQAWMTDSSLWGLLGDMGESLVAREKVAGQLVDSGQDLVVPQAMGDAIQTGTEKSVKLRLSLDAEL